MQIVYYTVMFLIRWDQLAYLAYGSTQYTPDLTNANRKMPLFGWLPVGAVVACPIITGAAVPNLTSALPEWKQL